MNIETVATYTFEGHDVSVVRQFDWEGDFYCYDLFLDETGECLNDGNPWFEGTGSATLTEPPHQVEVMEYLRPTWNEMFPN